MARPQKAFLRRGKKSNVIGWTICILHPSQPMGFSAWPVLSKTNKQTKKKRMYSMLAQVSL